MKTDTKKFTVAILCVIYILLIMVSGCEKSIFIYEKDDNEEPISPEENDSVFYYNFGEKFFVLQRTDMLCLKFSEYASKAQLLDLIGSDISLQPLQPMSTYSILDEGRPMRIAVLETIDGKQIPLATIELFKARPEVVSATYLIENNGHFGGLIDEFIVSLKETTSYTQLQELVEKNNCQVKKLGTMFFLISIPKTSKYNAMQMANLFYETGLFLTSAPNFVTFNALILPMVVVPTNGMMKWGMD